MIIHHRAHSLKALFTSYIDRSSFQKRGRAFAPNWIVVQNREMQQWLSLQEARTNGISANNEFIFPSELLWKLYRFLEPELPRQLPSDRIPMQWQIFDLLENDKLSFLHFVAGDQQSRFRFAGQLADVFDQYQVYRPDMLAAWQAGRMTTTVAEEEPWQLRVWKMLTEQWETSYPDLPNRLQASERIKREVDNEAFKDHLPGIISVFGLSHLSRPFAELIGVLSDHIDIHVYSLIHDSDDSWSQLQNDWGAMGLEAQQIMQELVQDKKGEVLITDAEEEHNTVLNRPEAIKLHSCHNERREVEALKDELLKKLDEHPGLSLNDVLVLVPDMESYSPWIQSVFSVGEEDEPVIPVYIPDNYRSSAQMAFVRLLEFLNGRATVSAFMDLISTDSVMGKYGLDEESVQTLKGWLVELQTHWGLEEAEGNYSLEKALHRIIAGYMMEPESFQLWEGIAPSEQSGVSETPLIAGALSEVIHLLKKFRNETRETRDAAGWIRLLQQWALSFFGDNDGDRVRLKKSLEQMEASTLYGKEGSSIPFSILANWLAEQFSENAASSNGLGNGLVVSTYIPYRSIPFRFVAILGLNEGVFPRNPARPHFDLIQQDSRPGDRITKKDDRLLFWELLNATQDHLHLSYKGQDQHSDQEKLPSILVQRLMDEMQSVKGLKPEIKKHKLHGFSEHYFDGQQSYSGQRLAVLRANQATAIRERVFCDQEELLSGSEELQEIELHQLISFFSNPSKYFCQTMVGIRYPFQDSELKDREVFQLNQLDGYTAKALSLEAFLDHKEEPSIRNYLDARGMVPPGIHGDAELTAVFDQVHQLMQDSGLRERSERTSQEVEIRIEGYRLTGVVNNIYGDRLLHYRVGRTRAIDLIDLWISHLAMATSGSPLNSELYTITSGKTESNSFGVVEQPDLILGDLLTWFVNARQSQASLAFVPECSRAYQETSEEKDEAKAVEQAFNEWEGNKYKRGEKQDPYQSLVWSWEQLLRSESFRSLAVQFWKPLNEYRTEGGKG